jgi:hypothetical protein
MGLCAAHDNPVASSLDNVEVVIRIGLRGRTE